MRMIQLYKWDLPNSKIVTVAGEMLYKDWLMKEKDRIAADITRRVEIRFQSGMITLYVNKVACEYHGGETEDE